MQLHFIRFYQTFASCPTEWSFSDKPTSFAAVVSWCLALRLTAKYGIRAFPGFIRQRWGIRDSGCCWASTFWCSLMRTVFPNLRGRNTHLKDFPIITVCKNAAYNLYIIYHKKHWLYVCIFIKCTVSPPLLFNKSTCDPLIILSTDLATVSLSCFSPAQTFCQSAGVSAVHSPLSIANCCPTGFATLRSIIFTSY